MKRLVFLALLLAGLVGAAIAAAPFIAATDLAKRRIASQIEEWTGRPVAFTGEPRVKLFPFLSLTIEDARIGEAPGGDLAPFVAMDALTCNLRLLPFLIGRVDVAEFELVRPRFRFTVDAEGRANWLLPGGTDAPGRERTAQQIAEIKLGRFKIVDGTVIYDNALSGRREEFGAMTLSLAWPAVAEAVSGTGAFTWRGETVEFNASVSEPLNLIAGGASAARFALASRPLRVSFTGTADTLADRQLKGSTTVTAPSVRRVAAWFATPLGEGSILGAGLIEGEMNWTGRSLSFSEARIELDGNNAQGALALDLGGPRPKVQGTLALDRLDLSAYIESFHAAIDRDGPWPLAEIRMPLLDIADANIRLSAGQILISSARIGQSAATVALDDGRLAVALTEAQFYGGSLDVEAELAMSGGVLDGSARMALANAPAGVVLDDLLGVSVLDGAASATVAVAGRGETWGALVEALTGTARIEVAGGSLIGFELGQLAALSGGPAVVDPAAGSGTIPFRSLTGTLTLADGAIETDDLGVESEIFAITLAGRMSLIDAAVRAKGVLTAGGAAAGQWDETPFVVSGSWADPLLLPDYERLIERGAEGERLIPPGDSASGPVRPNG